MEGVGEREGVSEGVGEREGVIEGVSEGVGEREGVSEVVPEGVGEREGVAEGVRLLDGVAEGVGLREGEGVGVKVWLPAIIGSCASSTRASRALRRAMRGRAREDAIAGRGAKARRERVL